MADLTVDMIPKASGANVLTDGYTVVTTLDDPGDDTTFATEAAIRAAITAAGGHGTSANFKDHTDINAAVSDSDAQGDLVVRNATEWTRLGTGTSGQYLKSQGAAANLVWATLAGGGDLLADGSVPLTANWDVGAFTITATQFKSDIAEGTAPFTVDSTTVVTGLNSDELDGLHAASFLQDLTGSPLDELQNVAAISEAQGQVLFVNATPAWAALAVGSDGDVLTTHGAASDPTWETPAAGHGTTTDIKNHGDVAAAVTDSMAQGDVYFANSTPALTRLAPGTAGYVLTSGGAAADVSWTSAGAGDLLADGTVPLTANWDAGGYEIRAQTFESDVTTGTPPLVIESTTLVSNLNAEFLNGSGVAAFVKRDGTTALTDNWDMGTFYVQATQFRSDIAEGTPPFTVDSTTVVSGLNSDELDGLHAASFLQDVTGSPLDELSNVAAIAEAVGMVLYVNATPAWAALAAGSEGEVLTAHGAAAVTWEAAASGHGTTANLDDHADVNAAVSDSDAQGDVIVRNDTEWTRLGTGTDGQVLTSGGAAANLAWEAIVISGSPLDELSNVAAITETHGQILFVNSTPAWAALAVGTDGYVLQSGGADADVAWTAPDDLISRVLTIKLFADDTLPTTGNGAQHWTVPAPLAGWNLTDVEAHVYTASSGGTTTTVMIHNLTQTADMLSTIISIDATEKDSLTAATPPVIDAGEDDVASGEELRFDVDAVGDGDVRGLEVRMTFTKP